MKERGWAGSSHRPACSACYLARYTTRAGLGSGAIPVRAGSLSYTATGPPAARQGLAAGAALRTGHLAHAGGQRLSLHSDFSYDAAQYTGR
ncbi:hypothetical protein CBM2634_B180029 [Cupriavidus taiwanensis]|uniref:Uncharacterized protein n=1 Tax=Cupriavidus taiwanensis TaxID=164546 RepID=A0A375JB28_9BURK|nr:hypothetical protein CBM2634_B180029 [Cupriavidus taiwanensis]